MAAVEIVDYSGQHPSGPTPSRGDALVLSGRGYSAEQPLLAWILRMLHGSGWWCTTVRWSVDDVVAAGDATEFVESVARRLHDRRRTDGPTLVVGKSLGTLAMGWARELALPAVWVTPLLQRPETVTQLVGYPAPALLIGGTADPMWDSAAAARSGAEVLEVPGADHDLMLAGPWQPSHEVERTVIGSVATFAGRVAGR